MQITNSPLMDHPLEASFQAAITDADSPAAWCAAGQMMLDLLSYLREQVAGPPVWATVGHLELRLALDPAIERSQVLCSAWNGVYTISCAARLEHALWERAVLVDRVVSLRAAGNRVVRNIRYLAGEGA